MNRRQSLHLRRQLGDYRRQMLDLRRDVVLPQKKARAAALAFNVSGYSR